MPRRDASLQSDYSSFVQRAPLLYVKQVHVGAVHGLGIKPLIPLVPFLAPQLIYYKGVGKGEGNLFFIG